MLEPRDYVIGLIKAAFFGGIIAVSSCHFGLSTSGGAPGVGRSVNAAVVGSAVAIFVVDFFSTFVLG
jgi:phospholipid/cholesterol/gamma-HCH transport system permease protein